MTDQEIRLLVSGLEQKGKVVCLEETHISWVILCEGLAFKVKKPVRFSFLDFSTLQKRNRFCHREVVLNRRLTRGVYLEVVAICRRGGQIGFGKGGRVIDYAVKMKQLDSSRRMDLLLSQNQVTTENIQHLADQLMDFHQNATKVGEVDYHLAGGKFDDLLGVLEVIKKNLGEQWAQVVVDAVDASGAFLKHNTSLFLERAGKGFVVDGHGDLHTKNVFLTPDPVIFDCIEFSDDLRRVDVLNELAFLYMDLEAGGHAWLGRQLLDYYRNKHEVITRPEEEGLFRYYVAYRANVRAKVALLEVEDHLNHGRAGEAGAGSNKAERYLELMQKYLDKINPVPGMGKVSK